MIVNSKFMAVLVIIIFSGGILLSNGAGWWLTESTKEAAVFTSGEFAGQANPEDIRGSYTFGDVQKNFAIPVSVLATAFGVQMDDPASLQVKELESLNSEDATEIGTASVRLFVAFYLGLPYDLSVDTYLPESASLLLQDRNLTSDRMDYLVIHTIPATTNPPLESAPTNTSIPPQDRGSVSSPAPILAPVVEPTATSAVSLSGNPDRQVKGKTSFGELLEWGVSQEAIEMLIGLPIPASTGMTVKDFCTANDLSFEEIRTALQVEVNNLQ